jgi:hypothetical protein
LELSSLLLMCEHRLRILKRGDDWSRHRIWRRRTLVRPALAHLHGHIGEQTGKRGLKRKGLSVFNLEDVTPGRQNRSEGFYVSTGRTYGSG